MTNKKLNFRLLTTSLTACIFFMGIGCAKTIEIAPGTCPLPPSLSKEDSDKVTKFGLEVSGVAKGIAGGKLDAEVGSKLKQEFPGAADVNRIYALTYAACVSCRVSPGSVKDCAIGFTKILDKYTSKQAESTASSRANQYQADIFKDLM